jgi:prephenate dehydrogenase
MKLRTQIVGTGLIGTSIALNLAEKGWPLELVDTSERELELAKALIPNAIKLDKIELVIVATPPALALDAIRKAHKLNPQALILDVGSVKSKLQDEISSFPDIAKRFIGTHPIAGREKRGAQSARSDLFLERAWIICPTEKAQPEDLDKTIQLVKTLGANPYIMSPREHDNVLARISHLPQILSVVLASSISDLGDDLSLAGQGLRDMLRISASDGRLWAEILLKNQEEVIEAVEDFQDILESLLEAIEDNDEMKIIEIFDDVKNVSKKVSAKHGMKPREYSYLNVVIDDKPGQLGALFNECGEIGVNVEDLNIEHSPNQETGLIRLALSETDSNSLEIHLKSKGWKVHR